MATTLRPHLMFTGEAEQAIALYISVFGGSVEEIERYEDGTIKLAVLRLVGQEVSVIDSPIEHDFTFTPSLALFVQCESAEELETAFATLSEGGQVMMPLDDYGFSTRFGCCSDRYGVCWQLNLP